MVWHFFFGEFFLINDTTLYGVRWPGLDYICNNFHIRKMRMKKAERIVADWNWFIPCNGWQLHIMVMICRRAKKCLALATTNYCLVTIDFVILNSVEYYLPSSIFAFRIILNLHSLIHLHTHTHAYSLIYNAKLKLFNDHLAKTEMCVTTMTTTSFHYRNQWQFTILR